MNYATMGSYIGHKYVRSVDDFGRQVNARGIYIGSGWTDETQNKYHESTQCYVDQYNKYTEPFTRLTVDGKKTRDVNIADNVGLKIAYKAYKQWVVKNSDEHILPGLKYNAEQLFFIANAQMWCSKANKKHLNMTIVDGKEAPAQFRVNGPVSNFQPFADAFKCTPNSPMNPRGKCEVW